MPYDSVEARTDTGDRSPGLYRGVEEVEVTDRLVARSSAMCALLGAMDRCLDAPYVLIEGETGAGKDRVARVFHQRADGGASPLRELDAPHTSLRCFTASLQRLCPLATGGTLVVSEIGDLSHEHQVALLRFLDAVADSHRIRTEPRGRIVCLTQHDADDETRQGRLLGGLRERLEPYSLRVPALRERAEDLPVLIRSLLRELTALYGSAPRKLSPEVWEALLAHPWKGNVRELRNELERLVVLTPGGRSVGTAALSPALLAQGGAAPSPGPPGPELRCRRGRGSVWRRWLHSPRVPMTTHRVWSGEPTPSGVELRTWPCRARRRSRRRSHRRFRPRPS